MKHSIPASLVLLCAAVLLPAPATADVYVDFTNQLYGFKASREQDTGYELRKDETVVVQVLYACDGPFTEVPQGSELLYCPHEAHAKLVWERTTETCRHGAPCSWPIGLDPTRIETQRTIGPVAHCAPDDVGVREVRATGFEKMSVKARPGCIAKAPPPPAEPEQWRPKYAFEVYLGESLSGRDAPAHTTVIACHDWDISQWSEQTPGPWEHVRCDARYGAIVRVRPESRGDVVTTIEAPYRNPCTEGNPVYRVNATGLDSADAYPTLEAEHEWCK